MSAYENWLLPTDDPTVRRHRAEVLAFTATADEPVAVQLAQSPPRPRPPASVGAPQPQPQPQIVAAAPPRRTPAVDPARVRALLDGELQPGAAALPTDPATTRRELFQLFADLDALARRLAAGAAGG